MTIDYTFTVRSINAGSFIVGQTYTIQNIGTTDFTSIGASANNNGVTFVASGVGTGTGTAFSTIIVPEDGTDITSTSLTLSGRGSLNWGEAVQQNSISMLENFAGPTSPLNPILGQAWFDTTTGNLTINDSSIPTGPHWNEVAYTADVASNTGVTGPFTVGNPIAPTDAVNLGYLETFPGVSGPFLVGDPTNPLDATNVQYVNTYFAPIGGVLNSFTVGAPIGPTDAVQLQTLNQYAFINGSTSEIFDVQAPTGPTGFAGPAIPLAFADARYILAASGTVRAELKSIIATVASNSLTFGIKTGQTVDFRSTNYDDGTITLLSAASNIVATVPYTATLGAANGFNRLFIGAINNGGVMEVAICNTTNPELLDEDELISTQALLGTHSINTFNAPISGSGYTSNYYPNVPLSGGSGTGALANITVSDISAGYSTIAFSPAIAPTTALNLQAGLYSIEISVNGGASTAYSVNATGGAASGLSLTSGGSLYTPGTYSNVPLVYVTQPTSPKIGGTGITATIVVGGTGVVTGINVISTPGSGYAAGDVLTAPSLPPIGTGSGFTATITSVTGSDTMTSLVALMNAQLGAAAAAATTTSSGFKVTSPTLGTNSSLSIIVPASLGAGADLIASIEASKTVTYTNVQTAGITGVSSVLISPQTTGGNQGSGYAIGNSLTTAAANIGGTGAGFSVTVASVNTGSNVANTWYSATARTNVAYRIVGFIELTESPGVWSSNPSLIQGAGGLNMIPYATPVIVPNQLLVQPGGYAVANSGAIQGHANVMAELANFRIGQSGTYTIESALASTAHTVTSQIYKNGVAYGNYNTLTGAGAGNYRSAVFYENLLFSLGDTIQIFGEDHSGGDYTYYTATAQMIIYALNSSILAFPSALSVGVRL